VQIGILEGDGFSEKALDILRRFGAVDAYAGGTLAGFLAGKEVLFVRLSYRIDESLLRLAPNLRYLCSPTTGHNHIDLKALAARSILLFSLQGEQEFLAGIRATPEHTLGLVLALLRKYRHAFLDLNNDRWDRDKYRGEELCGNTVGIIGFGRVGRILNDYFQVFGAKVYFCDPDSGATSKTAVRCDKLQDLIERSSIIVLCASHSERTGVLLAAEHIACMRGKYLVNTARGELIDEVALLEYIQHDHFAGVATDVVENESGPNRLRQWLEAAQGRNVIVTPHIGGATFSSMQATEEFVAAKLERSVTGTLDC
jgi:D-3-phosphoglycerate dehydrogenase / 2-oxoglutarate reductase